MFRKSSYSIGNGDCVEAGEWRNSTFSAAGNCVEARSMPSAVGVRDTKEAGSQDRTELAFSAAAWRAFISRVKAR